MFVDGREQNGGNTPWGEATQQSDDGTSPTPKTMGRYELIRPLSNTLVGIFSGALPKTDDVIRAVEQELVSLPFLTLDQYLNLRGTLERFYAVAVSECEELKQIGESSSERSEYLDLVLRRHLFIAFAGHINREYLFGQNLILDFRNLPSTNKLHDSFDIACEPGQIRSTAYFHAPQGRIPVLLLDFRPGYHGRSSFDPQQGIITLDHASLQSRAERNHVGTIRSNAEIAAKISENFDPPELEFRVLMAQFCIAVGNKFTDTVEASNALAFGIMLEECNHAFDETFLHDLSGVKAHVGLLYGEVLDRILHQHCLCRRLYHALRKGDHSTGVVDQALVEVSAHLNVLTHGKSAYLILEHSYCQLVHSLALRKGITDPIWDFSPVHLRAAVMVTALLAREAGWANIYELELLIEHNRDTAKGYDYLSNAGLSEESARYLLRTLRKLVTIPTEKLNQLGERAYTRNIKIDKSEIKYPGVGAV